MIAAGIGGIKPKDALEEMIAAQMLACHDAAMDSYRFALDSYQRNYPRLYSDYLNQAGKLSRTFSMLLDALNRHRGKGQQKITVEHVHVHPGGQAVVGVAEAGGGVNAKSENQGHGKGKPRARFHRGEEIGIRWHHPEEWSGICRSSSHNATWQKWTCRPSRR
jgi:hypothetical protein